MSKRINVNPDHYKVAGRMRQGENIVRDVSKRAVKRLRREERRPSTEAPAPQPSRLAKKAATRASRAKRPKAQ